MAQTSVIEIFLAVHRNYFSRPAVVGVLVLTSFAFGQSYRGAIRGRVEDASGAVVREAKVNVKNLGSGLMRETTSAADGAYSLPQLPAGEYEVTVVAPRFDRTVTRVIVAVGSDTAANIQLRVGAHEQVIATAEAPTIDITQSVLSAVVDQKLVEQLPVNGRDFGKLVALSPGSTVDPSGVAGTQGGFGQFNINGNRDRSNNYTLDGTDDNDPFFNNSALNQTGIGGAPASLLPIDAIQEFNLESQFGAEYGRNSGSVVNIVTKSGTNGAHGSAFGFLRNSALDARNYFNIEAKKSVFQNTTSVSRSVVRSGKTKRFSSAPMRDNESELAQTSYFSCQPPRKSRPLDQLLCPSTEAS